MTPTLPDRRQPRPVEQQLEREGDRVWDLAALASLTAGWDARAERRVTVRRLSQEDGSGPYPGQVSSAREPAESTRPRLCVEPEQGTPSADDGRGLRTSYPISGPGPEPSGVTPVRAADGPGATSSDGGSPETERATGDVPSPDRTHKQLGATVERLSRRPGVDELPRGEA